MDVIYTLLKAEIFTLAAKLKVYIIVLLHYYILKYILDL